MDLDISIYTDPEITSIVNKFISAGWKQEDEAYLTKDIGISTNPEAKNEKWKTSLGIVLFPKLLTYYNGKKWKTEPWIAIRTSINTPSEKYLEDSERLRSVAKYLTKEIKNIGMSPFKDEDAFVQHFDRPKERKNTGSTEISCYVNPSFPEGYWSNHALD